MTTLFTRVLHRLWYVLAAIIILVALLVSITRLMTPVLNDHRADFERLASNVLQMPVLIRDVEVSWHGYSPEIILYSLTLLDPDTQKTILNMDRLEIDFSIWRTLLERKIFIRNVTLSGMELTITQMAPGQIQIGQLTSLNIKDTLTGSSVKTDQVFAWVFSQPRLALENINMLYVTPDEDTRSVTLKSLALNNTGQHHVVDGKAVLNQELPIKMDVHLGWDGDVRHLEQAKGHFYLYLEGLLLKQWFSKMSWDGVQIRKGLASIKIWGNWENNLWQKIQTTFQAYNLEFYSVTQKRSEAIDRLSGNIGWKRDGDLQIYSGDNIYIDFPLHLWPATNFSVKIATDASGKVTLKSVQFNYMNLADSMKVLSMSGSLFADSIRQQLLDLNPRGEIQNLQVTVPDPMTDVQHLVLTSEFNGLTLNGMKQLPGVSNLKGSVNWNQTQGEIKLDSTHVFLTAEQIYPKPLYFEQLSADILLKRTETGDLSATAKNINVSNADLNATTNFNLTALQTDNPDVDFSAQFNINKVASLVNYLPAKIMDHDLSTWLRHAFKQGEVSGGVATVTGKFKDFPYDNNTGKFLVTMQLKNMDLNFAPGWPDLTNMIGDLTFAGRVMRVNVQSGAIAGIPVKKITAIIPYIGDASPQILNVDALLQSNFAQGLSFIHQSPLEKTLGKDLAGMDLKGGMELTLGMSIPLRHPENTAVKGNTVMSAAELSLPQWKLTFDKLNGTFQFTDKGIEAKGVQGQLFGAPATLNVTTVYDNKKQTGQVQANIASVISIPSLENWAAISMSSVAQGTANYQAKLVLASHAKGSENQISISSNLQGVAINLPAPFAKKATDTGTFQLDLITNDTDVVKAKINYNKQITAALNLKAVGLKMQLIGGEIHFGSGSANWQKDPGLLISGDIKQLDWDTWQDYFKSIQPASTPLPPVAKTSATADIKLLRSVDLKIGTLGIMGQDLHGVAVQVINSIEGWDINLDSNELGGQISFPYNLTSQPVQAKFQHVNIDTTVAKKIKQKIDPRTLPAMNIESDITTIGDVKINNLFLNLEPTRTGLLIKQLRINEPILTLNAVGEWTSTNGRNSSHLEGSMSTPKVSDVLKEWGFDSTNFVGSKGEVKFNLDWPDTPYQLTLVGLSGNVSFNLGEGRIVELSDSSNAQIGFGRMLNIFSLSTIPRRLSLDFSDVTQKGFSFDYVKADFAVKNGNAITDNMKFDGPIARVEIKGRVGLVAKDFNVQLSVTPYVTGSIPVVAAFAGGPIVGVAALLVDKVVSQGVSKAITHKYTVTGPWANPVWTQVGATPQPVATQPQPRQKSR